MQLKRIIGLCLVVGLSIANEPVETIPQEQDPVVTMQVEALDDEIQSEYEPISETDSADSSQTPESQDPVGEVDKQSQQTEIVSEALKSLAATESNLTDSQEASIEKLIIHSASVENQSSYSKYAIILVSGSIAFHVAKSAEKVLYSLAMSPASADVISDYSIIAPLVCSIGAYLGGIYVPKVTNYLDSLLFRPSNDDVVLQQKKQN